MRILGLVVVALFWWTSGAEASCSGSGQNWSCTAGSSATEINSAISSASDGAVVTLQAGTYSAAGIALGTRNGVTIVCAAERACTMTAGQVFNVHTTNTYTNLMRISGFVFSNTNGAPATISLGYGNGDPRIDNLRIDHNTFRQISGISIATGHTAAIRRINGVIDNNLFEGSTHEYPLMILGAGNNDWGPSLQGTSEN